jgi:hypothetical protein
MEPQHRVDDRRAIATQPLRDVKGFRALILDPVKARGIVEEQEEVVPQAGGNEFDPVPPLAVGEGLNLASAASIALYEALRQNGFGFE